MLGAIDGDRRTRFAAGTEVHESSAGKYRERHANNDQLEESHSTIINGRNAVRRDDLFFAQRPDRIQRGRTPRRQQARRAGDDGEGADHAGVGDRIHGLDADQQALQSEADAQRQQQPDRQAAADQPGAVAGNQPEHVALRRADGQADADFAAPHADQVREHTVAADAGKRERERAKHDQQVAGHLLLVAALV